MIDDGNVFAFWDFLSRHALWIAAFLVLPLWWWMRQYKGERAGQAERQLGDLARLLGATLRRDDDFEAVGEGRFADRRFRLQRTLVEYRSSSRSGWRTEVRLSTPLEGMSSNHRVAFKDVPGWAPKLLRERPFIESGEPMPEGWYSEHIHELTRAVMDADASVGRLSIDAGELRWTIELFRSWSPLPSPEALRPRLFAMAELANAFDAMLQRRYRAVSA